jgi:ATP-dependent 26S proteasome regulatory subunit
MDASGRIICMTTNYPDKLDDALVRPGRIDKWVFMNFLKANEAAQMLNHYFDPELVTEEQHAYLEHILSERELPGGAMKAWDCSAATLEQLCSEHDQISTLLTELERRATHFLELEATRKAGGGKTLTTGLRQLSYSKRGETGTRSRGPSV